MIIYKATNKKTNKSYIGQTVRDLKVRKAEHLQASNNISRSRYPTPLQLALSQDGSGEFDWEVLETCGSMDHLNEREKFYIKLLNTMIPYGYNQTTGGAVDESMAEDVRRKISDTMVELHQNPEYQAKVYPKLKGLVPPNKGKPMTQEQKAKVSAAKKAVYADPSYVNPNVGQVRTEEQKANIRKGQEGNMATGEAWHTAHKDQYTTEVRAKMSAAKKGKKPANTKQVICLETGAVFNGLSAASAALGVNRQSIYLQIKGKIKAAGGLHFEYKP